MRGRNIDGEWYLSTIELHHGCPFCNDKRPIETLEFVPVLPCELGFKIECQWTFLGRRDEVLPTAYFTHKNCGPGWNYWIDIKRIRQGPDVWKRHMSTKTWCHEIFLDAIDMAVSRHRVPAPAPRRPRQVVTYFIQSEFGGHFKIGKSVNPESRLKTLQTGRADKLRIVKLIKGDVEAKLHQQFAHLREGGEWFKCDPILEAFIQETS